VTTSGTAANRAWGGNGFDAVSSAAAASAGDYAAITITPAAGCTVSFSSLSRFGYRRSSTGPTSGMLQYQIDLGAATDITSLAYPTANSGDSLSPIALSSTTALQNVGAGTNVTIRIVNYGGAEAGSWYVYDMTNSAKLDLVISGAVAPTNSISGPPAIAPTLSLPTITNNSVVFELTGTAGSNYVVQVGTNLTSWLNLHTNAAPFWFTNPIGAPQQFYRGAVAP